MARKPMTEEQKEKARQNLAKARAARQQNKEAQEEVSQADVNTNDVLAQLVAKVQELEGQLSSQQKFDETARLSKATVGNSGVQGIQYKWDINPDSYPDPTPQLYNEPSLSRYNLKENFRFKWGVTGVEYDKAGVNYAEPRFTVELWRIPSDMEKQEHPNITEIFIKRAILHEDEVAARRAAEKLGLTDTFGSFKEMMDAMRYHRIRKWLLDIFNPPQIETRKSSKEVVIGGKVVQVNQEAVSPAGGESQAAQLRREVAR